MGQEQALAQCLPMPATVFHCCGMYKWRTKSINYLFKVSFDILYFDYIWQNMWRFWSVNLFLQLFHHYGRAEACGLLGKFHFIATNRFITWFTQCLKQELGEHYLNRYYPNSPNKGHQYLKSLGFKHCWEESQSATHHCHFFQLWSCARRVIISVSRKI